MEFVGSTPDRGLAMGGMPTVAVGPKRTAVLFSGLRGPPAMGTLMAPRSPYDQKGRLLTSLGG